MLTWQRQNILPLDGPHKYVLLLILLTFHPTDKVTVWELFCRAQSLCSYFQSLVAYNRPGLTFPILYFPTCWLTRLHHELHQRHHPRPQPEAKSDFPKLMLLLFLDPHNPNPDHDHVLTLTSQIYDITTMWSVPCSVERGPKFISVIQEQHQHGDVGCIGYHNLHWVYNY